jgi:signal transduction histidine kinase/ActR/RegA family two-component response regulator
MTSPVGTPQQGPTENETTARRLAADLAAMTRLHEIARGFVREGDLPRLLEQVVEAALATVGADMATVELLEEHSGSLQIAAHRGLAQTFLDHFARRPAASVLAGTPLEQGKRVLVDDVETSLFGGTEDREAMIAAGIRATQLTPLRDREGKMLGLLSTHHRASPRFEDRDLELLDLIGIQCSEALERARWAAACLAQNQSAQELQEADRVKSEFIAVLSHELRNPLAAIRSSLYVLERGEPGGDASTRARSIVERQVGQLSRIADDLLDVTRITQNKIRLKLERLDFNQLVRQTIADNRSHLERSGVSLEVKLAPAPVYVNADAARIAQVVTNLLSNAAKFTPAGGSATVTLRADSAGSGAVLIVADTGAGIEPELLDRLFKPFAQADRTRDMSRGGLGLGLALVKGLVDLHGGKVSARSDGLNKGTEITVSLPLATATATTSTAPATGGALPKRRVLVIEDNADVAESMRAALQFDGHQVEIAHDGHDGLERALAHVPDVVLCDLGLPKMDGYQVAMKLRANEASTSMLLVALSGYAQEEDVERARSAGFDLHAAKPVSIDRLRQILGTVKAKGAL